VDPLPLEEYRSLRAAIRERGALRVILFVGAMAAWALVAGLVAGFVPMPLASLVPLLVLMAGFEAVHALHVGAERIGRYVYVRYESAIPGGADRPIEARALWETAIAAFGAGQPTPAIWARPAEALFSLVFCCAIAVNALVLTLGATRQELAALGAVHFLCVARIFLSRRAAALQRPRDEKRFAEILK